MKSKLALIGLLVIISVALFYWFSLRPAKIKRACAYKALQAAKDTQFYGNVNGGYNFCLHQNGL